MPDRSPAFRGSPQAPRFERDVRSGQGVPRPHGRRVGPREAVFVRARDPRACPGWSCAGWAGPRSARTWSVRFWETLSRCRSTSTGLTTSPRRSAGTRFSFSRATRATPRKRSPRTILCAPEATARRRSPRRRARSAVPERRRPVCGIPGRDAAARGRRLFVFPLAPHTGCSRGGGNGRGGVRRAVGVIEARCEEYSAEAGESEAHRIAGKPGREDPLSFSPAGDSSNRWRAGGAASSTRTPRRSPTSRRSPSPTTTRSWDGSGARPGTSGSWSVSLEDEEDHPTAAKQADIALEIIELALRGRRPRGKRSGGEAREDPLRHDSW